MKKFRMHGAAFLVVALTITMLAGTTGASTIGPSVKLRDSVYTRVDKAVDWRTAAALAKELVHDGCESAHLATVTRPREQRAVARLMAGATENAWLGGFQRARALRADRGWKWITGERWRYTNWAPGEPNDTPFGTYIPGSEQRLEVFQGSGLWNDAPGFEKKLIIVESVDCDDDDDDHDDDDHDDDDEKNDD